MRKLSGYGPSLIVLVTAMLVLYVGPRAVEEITYKQTEARMIQASLRLEEGNVLAQLNQAYQDVAAFVEPSVVYISAQAEVPNRRGVSSVSSGSGWIYDDEGHVVTNYHVVKDADEIEIQLASGELRPGTVLGFDKSTDIAVVKIPEGHLHPAVLGNMFEPVEQGDLIFAFGSPFDFRFSMSSGIVSGKGRSVDVLGPRGYENFIQVDAAINPGNSGGPLTDFRGHVIGMNTAIATGRGSTLEQGQFAGIGLAIPLEMIEPVVSQIIENGFVEKGLLGIVPGRLDVNEAQRLGFIGSGVVITDAPADFPAARAGVRVNDIVTHVNGSEVSGPPQLRSIVSSMLPGQTAELRIWRPDPDNGNGAELTIEVELVKLDPLRDTGELPLDQREDRIAQLGIRKLSTSTPALAADLEIPFHRGVIVEETVEGSTLSSRIEPGTTIVEVMGYSFGNVEEFYALLRIYNLRRGVGVNYIRPDGTPGSTRLAVEP